MLSQFVGITVSEAEPMHCASAWVPPRGHYVAVHPNPTADPDLQLWVNNNVAELLDCL